DGKLPTILPGGTEAGRKRRAVPLVDESTVVLEDRRALSDHFAPQYQETKAVRLVPSVRCYTFSVQGESGKADRFLVAREQGLVRDSATTIPIVGRRGSMLGMHLLVVSRIELALRDRQSVRFAQRSGND